MGRKRNRKDQWMPPRVYRGRSAYEWRPRSGGCIRLCPLDSQQEYVWTTYKLAKDKYESQGPTTFGDMLNEYLAGPQFRERAPATQTDYRQSAQTLRRVFGEARPEAITAPVIRKFMDARSAKTRANRERSLMNTVWNWAFERGLTNTPNPVPAVRQNIERKRDRYVSHREYLAVYRQAVPSVRTAMELAYLCGARQADILSLRWGRANQTSPDQGQNAVVLQQGIYIKQGKTGKKQIKLWSLRLRRAIHRAKINQAPVASLYVIHTRTGQRYTRSGFNTLFTRAKDKARTTGELPEPFTFHDIKAASISDYEGDKQRFSGHTTRAQMERYNRLTDEVPALGAECKNGGNIRKFRK